MSNKDIELRKLTKSDGTQVGIMTPAHAVYSDDGTRLDYTLEKKLEEGDFTAFGATEVDEIFEDAGIELPMTEEEKNEYLKQIAEINTKATATAALIERSNSFGQGCKVFQATASTDVLKSTDFAEANTIYEIQSDFSLSEDITMPSGCVLKFNGGKITEGTLTLTDTPIYYDGQQIFSSDVEITGTTPTKLSPLMFGVGKGTPEENFVALKACYKAANNLDTGVDWSEYSSLELEYPDETQEKIQLLKGKVNDFCGVEISITNKYDTGQYSLFNITNDDIIDGGDDDDKILTKAFANTDNQENGINKVPNTCDYTSLSDIATYAGIGSKNPLSNTSGRKLLVLKDLNLWTKRYNYFENQSESYGNRGELLKYYREDCFEVYNGKTQFTPCYTYNNKLANGTCTSLIEAKVYDVPSTQTTIENLTIKRIGGVTKTQLFKIDNMVDVRMSNVTVFTDRNDAGLTNDIMCSFVNCAHFIVENVNVYGLFDLSKSGSQQYAYGFYLENCSDMLFRNICTNDLNWGVFGTYSINSITVEKSNINRFDCHLYGKDIKMIDCNFKDKYCQFTGVYGTIHYERCKFDVNFKPLVLGGEMNVWVPFDVKFINCEKVLGGNYQNFLIWIYMLYQNKNERAELSTKNLPNVYVSNISLSGANINSNTFGIFRRDKSLLKIDEQYDYNSDTSSTGRDTEYTRDQELADHSLITFDNINEVRIDGLKFQSTNINYPLSIKTNVIDGTDDADADYYVYTENDVAIIVNDAQLMLGKDYNELVGTFGRLNFTHFYFSSGHLPRLYVTNSSFSFGRENDYKQKLICNNCDVYNFNWYGSSITLTEDNRHYFTGCNIMLNSRTNSTTYLVENCSFYKCGFKRFNLAYIASTDTLESRTKYIQFQTKSSIIKECYEIDGDDTTPLMLNGIAGGYDLFDTVTYGTCNKLSTLLPFSTLPELNSTYRARCYKVGDADYYWDGTQWNKQTVQTETT